MRVAPIGLIGPKGDAGAVFGLAAESAALTHGHPSGYLSAAVVASIVRLLVDGVELDTARCTTARRYRTKLRTPTGFSESRGDAGGCERGRSSRCQRLAQPLLGLKLKLGAPPGAMRKQWRRLAVDGWEKKLWPSRSMPFCRLHRSSSRIDRDKPQWRQRQHGEHRRSVVGSYERLGGCPTIG